MKYKKRREKLQERIKDWENLQRILDANQRRAFRKPGSLNY